MITNLYTRTTPINQIVANSARKIFDLLLTRQSVIASQDYNHHKTPYLHDVLQPSLANITNTVDGVDISINYPSTIRFLDLKKDRYGKRKRYYTAIYNRPLFGHIYGRGYSLSNVINAELSREYQNYYNNLQNVMHAIKL